MFSSRDSLLNASENVIVGKVLSVEELHSIDYSNLNIYYREYTVLVLDVIKGQYLIGDEISVVVPTKIGSTPSTVFGLLHQFFIGYSNVTNIIPAQFSTGDTYELFLGLMTIETDIPESVPRWENTPRNILWSSQHGINNSCTVQ